MTTQVIPEPVHDLNQIIDELNNWLQELYQKYNIKFDTLVIDCEGAFYYILQDMPEILNNINLIIMENDYNDFSHKIYIDNLLKANNFIIDYQQAGGRGPCYECFFQVWMRKI